MIEPDDGLLFVAKNSWVDWGMYCQEKSPRKISGAFEFRYQGCEQSVRVFQYMSDGLQHPHPLMR
jgi:predicted secreted acid phosphatase